MGIITLVFLVCLSVIALNNTWDNKPQALGQMAARLQPYVENLGFWGIIFSVAAFLLAMLSSLNTTELTFRLLANLLIFFLALPYGYERVMVLLKGRLDNRPELREESLEFVSSLRSLEKYLGFAGLGLSVVLFILIFP